MKPDRGGEGETKLPLGVIEGPIKKKKKKWAVVMGGVGVATRSPWRPSNLTQAG